MTAISHPDGHCANLTCDNLATTSVVDGKIVPDLCAQCSEDRLVEGLLEGSAEYASAGLLRGGERAWEVEL